MVDGCRLASLGVFDGFRISHFASRISVDLSGPGASGWGERSGRARLWGLFEEQPLGDLDACGADSAGVSPQGAQERSV